MTESSEGILKAVEDRRQTLRVAEGGKGCSERESSACNLSSGREDHSRINGRQQLPYSGNCLAGVAEHRGDSRRFRTAEFAWSLIQSPSHHHGLSPEGRDISLAWRVEAFGRGTVKEKEKRSGLSDIWGSVTGWRGTRMGWKEGREILND